MQKLDTSSYAKYVIDRVNELAAAEKVSRGAIYSEGEDIFEPDMHSTETAAVDVSFEIAGVDVSFENAGVDVSEDLKKNWTTSKIQEWMSPLKTLQAEECMST